MHFLDKKTVLQAIWFSKRFSNVTCHKLLPKKGVRVCVCACVCVCIPNDCLTSYLSKRPRFVSINGFGLKYKIIKYGVPQGSVLWPLLLLISNVIY